MQGACQPVAGAREPSALAPAWHTLLLLVWLLMAAVVGVIWGEPTAPFAGSRIERVYVPLSLASLALASYVTRLGLPASIFRPLWGRAPRGVAALATDIAFGVGTVAVVLAVEAALAREVAPSIRALLPVSPGEKLAWLMTSLAVGSSEELIYRGYLQRQLSAWLSPAWGTLLQAALFAAAHLDQGAGAALLSGGYGLAFGALTRARGSLTSAVVAHVLLNIYAGSSG